MCDPLSVLGVPPGPSGSEQSLGAAESTLSRDLMANYQQEYGEQQDALKQLTSEISQIRSGQTGPGFGAAELSARTSDIVNQAAAGERNAIQAEQNRAAGQVFGGVGDTSGLARTAGIQRQITGEITSAGETAKANALNRLTAENYAQGRINAEQTVGGLERLAGLYSPLGYAGAASSTGQAAFGEENKIQEQQAAHEGGIGALIEGGLSALTGGASSLISKFNPNADTSILDVLSGG